MCGIAGIVGTGPVNQRLYDALTILQHRGQDAAGIVTAVDGLVSMRKGSGLVRDVFSQQDMLELRGNTERLLTEFGLDAPTLLTQEIFNRQWLISSAARLAGTPDCNCDCMY